MNRSYLIAGGVLVALTAYMLTGMLDGRADSAPGEEATLNDSLGKAIMTVRVRELEAVEIPREVSVYGRTAAARELLVRAETGGPVVAIEATRGEPLEAGTVLVRLAAQSRPETIARAEAELEARRIDYAAAQRLAEEQLESGSRLAAARAALEATREALALARLDLAHTTIKAPFDGVMNEHLVEVGDYVQGGDPVARFLEVDPLIVTGEVTERQVAQVKVGEHGIARLHTGETLEGRIRFVDTAADPETRTFSVELEVPNPGARTPAGMTAQIVIETETVPAYEISAAHVSLDDEGAFGVKYVDADQRVRFAPVDIVRTTPRSLWLTGLPESLRLITVGQGFTKAGDQVEVVLEGDESGEE
ncbi:MAG: efflux RND transporter periplasmic adaptor subunit [Opitutales bacterium]